MSCDYAPECVEDFCKPEANKQGVEENYNKRNFNFDKKITLVVARAETWSPLEQKNISAQKYIESPTN